PFPSAAQRATALAKLSAVPGGCPIVLDGLAFGALPEAGVLRSRTPLIALVHQPCALEPGLDTNKADNFRASERPALAAAARVARLGYERGHRADRGRRLERPVPAYQRGATG